MGFWLLFLGPNKKCAVSKIRVVGIGPHTANVGDKEDGLGWRPKEEGDESIAGSINGTGDYGVL